jgi:hypothetical protein
MQPLNPTPLLQLHYQPSSLIQVDPPQLFASVLSPHGVFHLRFSLIIESLVPAVPNKSPDQIHAIYTPDAIYTVFRCPVDSS